MFASMFVAFSFVCVLCTCSGDNFTVLLEYCVQDVLVLHKKNVHICTVWNHMNVCL